MGTVIQASSTRSNDDRHPRWDRTRTRCTSLISMRDLQAQGLSLRQAAKALEVPRSTLQAWRAYQESLDEHPARRGLFSKRPRAGLPASSGARDTPGVYRSGCLWHSPGVSAAAHSRALIALSAPPMGPSTRSTVRWRRRSWRIATRKARVWPKTCPPKTITLAKDETFTGGLCLVAMDPKSNYIRLGASGPRPRSRHVACAHGAGACGSQLSGHPIDQR